MSVYDYSAQTLDGQDVSLADYRGKVLLIVNTASKCGFTPQYEGLEALYKANKDRGFTILAFPCNQFGAQEPGNAEEIANFCSLTYDVTFPMFAKVDVNGPNAHPLFRWLTQALPGWLGRKIRWNFTKFLIDGQGRPLRRFATITRPDKLEPHIRRALGLA